MRAAPGLLVLAISISGEVKGTDWIDVYVVQGGRAEGGRGKGEEGRGKREGGWGWGDEGRNQIQGSRFDQEIRNKKQRERIED